MKLSQFKNHLTKFSSLNFSLPSGEHIPSHFHITEAGLVTKNFIDCGGTIRAEKIITFQLWVAGDTDHRLDSAKLLNIISKYEKQFGNEDLDIEIEYQSDTIGRYGLDVLENGFQLTAKKTDCLAKDNCGVPEEKQKRVLIETEKETCCTPGGGCC